MIGVELVRTGATIDSELKKGTPSLSVTLETEANVGEIQCDMDLSKPETFEKIDKMVEANIKDKMKAAIKVTQEEYESDIFGFGSVINRNHPDYWKKIEQDWDNIFSDIDVKVNVDSDLRRKGTIIQPVQKEG